MRLLAATWWRGACELRAEKHALRPAERGPFWDSLVLSRRTAHVSRSTARVSRSTAHLSRSTAPVERLREPSDGSRKPSNGPSNGFGSRRTGEGALDGCRRDSRRQPSGRGCPSLKMSRFHFSAPRTAPTAPRACSGTIAYSIPAHQSRRTPPSASVGPRMSILSGLGGGASYDRTVKGEECSTREYRFCDLRC